MTKNNILYGLYLGLGFYLYRVLMNLFYNNLSFADSLVSMDWIKLAFMTAIGMVFSYFLDKRNSKK